MTIGDALCTQRGIISQALERLISGVERQAAPRFGQCLARRSAARSFGPGAGPCRSKCRAPTQQRAFSIGQRRGFRDEFTRRRRRHGGGQVFNGAKPGLGAEPSRRQQHLPRRLFRRLGSAGGAGEQAHLPRAGAWAGGARCAFCESEPKAGFSAHQMQALAGLSLTRRAFRHHGFSGNRGKLPRRMALLPAFKLRDGRINHAARRKGE